MFNRFKIGSGGTISINIIIIIIINVSIAVININPTVSNNSINGTYSPFIHLYSRNR